MSNMNYGNYVIMYHNILGFIFMGIDFKFAFKTKNIQISLNTELACQSNKPHGSFNSLSNISHEESFCRLFHCQFYLTTQQKLSYGA